MPDEFNNLTNPGTPPLDLKKILMILGNRLVTDCRYRPGVLPSTGGRDTYPITRLTEFINGSEEAQIILKDMGLDWSM